MSLASESALRLELTACCFVSVRLTPSVCYLPAAFARKVHSLLAPNGLFVLSVDHPVATACWGVHPVVIKSERNPLEIQYFPLDCYGEQGTRTAKYYVESDRTRTLCRRHAACDRRAKALRR